MYKAMLSNSQVMADMCKMLNVAITQGLIPSRWCQATSVLLEKNPGSANINRLHVIYIFEADYNTHKMVFEYPRLLDGHWNERAHALFANQIINSPFFE